MKTVIIIILILLIIIAGVYFFRIGVSKTEIPTAPYPSDNVLDSDRRDTRYDPAPLEKGATRREIVRERSERLSGFVRSEEKGPQPLIVQTSMNISSSVFEHNSLMPAKYTCDGEDINPPLQFSGVPDEAKSLVLIMDDPDAPTGTWVHWTAWNISAQITGIAQNSVPSGVIEGKQSWGRSGYGGPCPPSGTHRYFFKLYALDTMLDLSFEADKPELVNAMKDHIIAQAELIGLYQRQ